MADRDVVRRLAARWMEIAGQPVMAERRRQWTALKDLRGERPMVLFETWTLENYVSGDELECSDPLLRGVEHRMRWVIRHAEEVGDDIVVEPVWRVGYDIHGDGYGVEIRSHGAQDSEGGCVGYAFNHPVRTPDDVKRLRPQSWRVDRASTTARVERLQEAFGDLLPVALHGTAGMHAGLTGDAFRLIGNDNLLTWPYDAPEALHQLMAYLRDDRMAFHSWLEAEGLVGLDNNSTHVGSGSPGYVSELPRSAPGEQVRLSDVWLWMESQETVAISPRMFGEFFLPYMADVCRRLGLIYYGCCEPVHDRWEAIRGAIPQVRAVSISPWCDMRFMGDALGRSCVFSRKPRPAPMSGVAPDWDGLAADLDDTIAAASGCNLEIIFRDVYRIHGDRPRLTRWARMAREKAEASV